MMASITKKELAQQMLISMSKLQSLLNREWYDELSDLGYKKNDKIISPRIFEFIKNIWGEFD